MNVGNLMDSAIVTLRRDSTLAEIYAVMNQYRQTDFPVIDETSQLVGMLYEEGIRKALKNSFQMTEGNATDFVEAARRTGRLLNLRAEEIMTPDIGWVTTETSLGKVTATMEDKNVRCLPVFGDGRVLGIISDRAIFMALLKQGLAFRNAQELGKAQAELREKAIAEKRRHPRKPASFKLAYKPVSFKIEYQPTDIYGNATAQQARIARCLNLSLGGMLIQASAACDQDDVLELVFEIPTLGNPIRRLARVTRAVPAAKAGGFDLGLVFLALSVQETAALASYLKSLPD